jgi:hypothetical protein
LSAYPLTPKLVVKEGKGGSCPLHAEARRQERKGVVVPSTPKLVVKKERSGYPPSTPKLVVKKGAPLPSSIY